MGQQFFKTTLLLAREPVVRAGLKDIWNAHMAQGSTFKAYDIPYCPTTAGVLPTAIITWDEAVTIHRKQIKVQNPDYRYEAFVCFYMDDYKFDGPRGIWHNCNYTLDVLRHFEGAITPDYSTYQDFPEAIKIYATYRMRLLGYWLGLNGIPVINNVRWGTHESWGYSFEGIPQNSIVAVGTAGGSPRPLNHRQCFEEGIFHMVEVLHPHTIIVYGSANYSCFKKLANEGIKIVSYPSKMAQAFGRRDEHEQE